MLDVVLTNPYRVLGVCSNSPMKERVANLSKINAFLKVGKPVSFPTDMQSLLPDIERTNEMVAEANSKLALPTDQFRYAQFWFINATSFDEIALNHLVAGDIDKAMSIWEKREDASSLQNRIVCNLIYSNVSEAITCAEKLYTSYKNDFVKAILGDNPPIDNKNVEYDFLDQLCERIGVDKVLSYVSNEDWKRHILSQAVKPLVDGLMNAVSVAKQSKGNGPEARYNAGTKLMNDTKAPLKQLKSLTDETDLQYQMVADKVGLEILQCGIDYYNHTKTYNAPKNAMMLMSYALSLVVGQVAKERCKENVDILQGVLDNLPPEVVKDEFRAIEWELQKFHKGTKYISDAVELLREIKPRLQSIKAKLGETNPRYLRLSTKVVENALYCVMKRVNSIEEKDNLDDAVHFHLGDGGITYFPIQEVFDDGRAAFREMDTFDIEYAFREIYNQSKSRFEDVYQWKKAKQERKNKEEEEWHRQFEKKIDEEVRKRKRAGKKKFILRISILSLIELSAFVLTIYVGLGFIALIIFVAMIMSFIIIRYSDKVVKNFVMHDYWKGNLDINRKTPTVSQNTNTTSTNASNKVKSTKHPSQPNEQKNYESAIEKVSKDEKCDPVFEGTEFPALVWDAIVKDNDGDDGVALIIVRTLLDRKQKSLEKAEKEAEEAHKIAEEAKTNPKGETLSEMIVYQNKAIERARAASDAVEAARKERDFWHGVHAEVMKHKRVPKIEGYALEQLPKDINSIPMYEEVESYNKIYDTIMKYYYDDNILMMFEDAADVLIEKRRVYNKLYEDLKNNVKGEKSGETSALTENKRERAKQAMSERDFWQGIVREAREYMDSKEIEQFVIRRMANNTDERPQYDKPESATMVMDILLECFNDNISVYASILRMKKKEVDFWCDVVQESMQGNLFVNDIIYISSCLEWIPKDEKGDPQYEMAESAILTWNVMEERMGLEDARKFANSTFENKIVERNFWQGVIDKNAG